jgi:hypothetical protein
MFSKKIEVKAIRVQAWKGRLVSRSRGLQISVQSAHEGGKVVSPTHRPALRPRKYSVRG